MDKYNNQQEKKREYQKRWREKNREYGRNYMRKWAESHRDEYNARARKWYFKNRKRCLEYQKKWRKNNPDKMKEYAKKKKEWAKNNPEKVKASLKRFRIKWREKHPYKNHYGDSWEIKRIETLKRDNYTCQVCGSQKDVEIHHIDGTGSNRKRDKMNNNVDNLITLCHRCHMKVEIKKKGNFNKGKWLEDIIRDERIYQLSKKMKQTKIAKLEGLTRQRINQIVKKYREKKGRVK